MLGGNRNFWGLKAETRRSGRWLTHHKELLESYVGRTMEVRDALVAFARHGAQILFGFEKTPDQRRMWQISFSPFGESPFLIVSF